MSAAADTATDAAAELAARGWRTHITAFVLQRPTTHAPIASARDQLARAGGSSSRER